MEEISVQTYYLEVTVIRTKEGPFFKVAFSPNYRGPFSVRYTSSVLSVSKELDDALFQEVFLHKPPFKE